MKISLHISFIAVRSNRTICSVQSLTVRGPHPSVSIIGGLVEPDVVSVEQPTIRETEVFGLIHGALEGALRAYENLNGLAAVGRQ